MTHSVALWWQQWDPVNSSNENVFLNSLSCCSPMHSLAYSCNLLSPCLVPTVSHNVFSSIHTQPHLHISSFKIDSFFIFFLWGYLWSMYMGCARYAHVCMQMPALYAHPRVSRGHGCLPLSTLFPLDRLSHWTWREATSWQTPVILLSLHPTVLGLPGFLHGDSGYSNWGSKTSIVLLPTKSFQPRISPSVTHLSEL